MRQRRAKKGGEKINFSWETRRIWGEKNGAKRTKNDKSAPVFLLSGSFPVVLHKKEGFRLNLKFAPLSLRLTKSPTISHRLVAYLAEFVAKLGCAS